eukprot:TRINITY_DN994_c0_g1_i1.p2 TRINITY_DN994_c0_g1~~TRINITY_DN994_c0_g1_i1.p2  ORF type:complete len:203 (-),score=53.62 TRINITY_DN994_c0_g1_i1:231-839(-)
MASYESYSGNIPPASLSQSMGYGENFLNEQNMVFSTIPGYDPETDVVRPDGDVNWDAPIVNFNASIQNFELDPKLVKKALKLVDFAEEQSARSIQLEVLNLLGVIHAEQIPDEFIPEVLVKMKEVGMSEEVKKFGARENNSLIAQLLTDDFEKVQEQLVNMEFFGLASQHAISRGQKEAYQSINEISARRSLERTFSDEIRS